MATWTLDAGSDTSKWALTFPDGTEAPVHIESVARDSALTSMCPCNSRSMGRRQVTADLVSRVHGDTLSGTYLMRLVAKPDPMHAGRFVAVRKDLYILARLLLIVRTTPHVLPAPAPSSTACVGATEISVELGVLHRTPAKDPTRS